MSSNRRKLVRLAECATFQEGYVNPSQQVPSYFGNKYKWLRATDLNNGFVHDTGRGLSQEGFDSAGKSALLFEPGTLAISKSGTIGRVGILMDYMCGNRAVINIKVNSDLDTRFIFYTLLVNRQKIETLAEGSVQKNLYISALGKLEVELPPLSDQRHISRTLAALDDRIAHLSETSATLEAIAQALFKSWFVDFDAVRAKMEGRAPEGMDEATAALFADGFEESMLGLIPRGWHVDILSSVCDSIFSGGTPDTRKTEYWTGELRWFASGETRDCIVVDTAKRISELAVGNSSTRLAKPGDILIASAGQGLTRGQTSYCAVETYINQSVVAVRTNPKKGHATWTFLNLSRRYDEMRSLSDSHSIRGSLTTKLIATMKVICPPVELIHGFGKIVEPLFTKQSENRRKADTLSQLRNVLLPRLISGQLRLPDAEALIEETA